MEQVISHLINTPLSTAVSVLKKLDLYLKDAESSVVTLAGFSLFIFCSSLLNCHRLQKCLNNYRHIQSNCT